MSCKSDKCSKPELEELRARVKELESALYGVLNSYEAYVARDKRYIPDDEYDEMMFPRWKKAFELMEQDVPFEPGDDQP